MKFRRPRLQRVRLRVTRQSIEQAMENDDMEEARRIILRQLAEEPDSHWLHCRLATTYYEQRRYKQALVHSRRALSMVPTCPLARWDHAGALEMLGRVDEALDFYRSLLRQGLDSLSKDVCSEGIRWTRSLVNDVRYRMGTCYLRIGKRGEAAQWFLRHKRHRSRATPSIYSAWELKRFLLELGAQHEK